MSEDSRKYESFFNDFSDFKERVLKSKMRGNNSYNPLLVIRKSNEELFHSTMLHSFLNPHSNHYQDSIFLDKFLETCKLKDKNLKEWFGETKHAHVYSEYSIDRKRIDLLIKNNYRYIILENKVWTGESPEQIKTYINKIAQMLGADLTTSESEDSIESNETLDEDSLNDFIESNNIYENMAVVFLTLWGDDVKSAKDWRIKGDFLESNNKKILYKAISYKDDIIKWIESCQSKEAVGNITNLNFALECYKDAVKEITNQRKDNMAITNFLDSEEKYAVAREIIEYSKKYKIDDSYLKDFVYGKCKERERLGEKWIMAENDSRFTSFREWRNDIVLFNEKYLNQTFRFMFDREIHYGEQREKWRYYGVRILVKHGDIKGFTEDSCNKIVKELDKIITKKFGTILNYDGWWFKDEYYYAKDINETIDLVNKVNDFLATDSQIATLAKELENIK
ncbi:hypothetical protein DCO58_08715 [Helicobacter saguini]|uniref:Uncharacterized protein n=1 Tax=Helicobacter saguini TaxID=1548018 RepID=A0A347VNX5_9HELI|nr:PD-(D/E)XK nuclease family protein [Helicobacter saguini]MWV61597.1 hypothetical protein [Helicobacter saguini]MWV67731.1 hypothetical protein [Helicobacter saguini]MWV70800.1 hypothetical protein [Helicobacter saguini]MWV72704.1 hypothetical protein [Helicobacter saguini]TLD94496.1 hypothetical protein LS64_004820 [Helicobacter saguini]